MIQRLMDGKNSKGIPKVGTRSDTLIGPTSGCTLVTERASTIFKTGWCDCTVLSNWSPFWCWISWRRRIRSCFWQFVWFWHELCLLSFCPLSQASAYYEFALKSFPTCALHRTRVAIEETILADFGKQCQKKTKNQIVILHKIWHSSAHARHIGYVGTPYIYTTAGFGLRKRRKCLAYTISWCICKLPQNTTLSIFTTTGARSSPVVMDIHTAVFLAVRIYAKKWYTPVIFWFSSRPKPGGGVYIYIYIYICIYGVPIMRTITPSHGRAC